MHHTAGEDGEDEAWLLKNEVNSNPSGATTTTTSNNDGGLEEKDESKRPKKMTKKGVKIMAGLGKASIPTFRPKAAGSSKKGGLLKSGPYR